MGLGAVVLVVEIARGENVLKNGMSGSATFSEDGFYRYKLTRQWGEVGSVIAWIMLNPSTASGEHDDATIRRCVNFSKLWGYGELVVYNLFAMRATFPRDLYSVDEATRVGPENDDYLRGIDAKTAIFFAWGAHGGAFLERVRAVHALFEGRTLVSCFGFVENGQPKHPLRLLSDSPTLEWESARKEFAKRFNPA